VAELVDLAAQKRAWVSVPFMVRYVFWAVSVKRMIADGEFNLCFETTSPEFVIALGTLEFDRKSWTA
jgi:hypothetical protein